MNKILYIIGNGFDLAHSLPTKFNPDFKIIADKHELNNFWEIYNSGDVDIWSDFENLLAYPDFNNLGAIFDGCTPDLLAEREYERDLIISQVGINGYLKEELKEFAENAENALNNIKKMEKFNNIITQNALYINFNYTHTLEKIYNIQKAQVLHVHGEVGKNNLILGYPKEKYKPEKFIYDYRKKGRPPYAEMGIEEYIKTEEN